MRFALAEENLGGLLMQNEALLYTCLLASARLNVMLHLCRELPTDDAEQLLEARPEPREAA